MNLLSIKSKWQWIGFIIVFSVLTACTDSRIKRVDNLFSRWDSKDSPGAALAIIDEGQIIYKRGYGMANLDYRIPITPETVFEIGSVSKQFTAACIALLIEEEKISLADDIRTYIPEFPGYERPITIQHLIHHTSGIRNILPLMRMACLPIENVYTNEDMVELIVNQEHLNFLPGEKYAYCNSGYFLLAAIVERVSEMSLAEFAREHIFKPLGMMNTFVYEDRTKIIKNRAIGYSPDGQGGLRMNHLFNFALSGPGQVYTTVEDFLLWDRNFYENKIGGPKFNELMQSPGSLNSGDTIDYAFGLRIGKYRGLKTIGHSGSHAGFRSHFIRFPAQSFTVICLANLSTINPSLICRQVADIYLADQFSEESAKEIKKTRIYPFTLSNEELEDKAGNYYDETSGTWVIISVKEEKLNIEVSGQSFLLSPVSRTSFQALDADLDIALAFLPNEEKERKVQLIMRGREFHLHKAAKIQPLNPNQLEEYAGEYYSDELLTTYRLDVEEDSLIFKKSFKQRNVPKSPLKSMTRDNFITGGMNIEFLRNKENQIVRFIMDAGRDKIEFIKK
jgi:CubicO group peptidase (beta-lactamase class C family)